MSKHEKYCKDTDCLEQIIAQLRTELADVKSDLKQTELCNENQCNQIVKLKADLAVAEKKRDSAMSLSKLSAQLKDTEYKRNKRLKSLLQDALPLIECKNQEQSNLITEIGECLQTLKGD